MGTHNFICCPGEHKIAYLGAGIHIVDVLKCQSVPEADTLVGSASACG
jgi:hypothetical protein